MSDAAHYPSHEDIRRELEIRLAQAPWHQRFRWRLGHRGAFLVMMGFLYGMLGYSYGFGHLPPFTVAQLEGPIRLVESLPGVPQDHTIALHVWGFIWMVTGCVAIITSWWPPGRDDIGFHALWIFSSVWAVLNFAGQVFLDAPRAAVVGAIFAFYAVTVLIVSGMVDPPPIVKIAANDGIENRAG